MYLIGYQESGLLYTASKELNHATKHYEQLDCLREAVQKCPELANKRGVTYHNARSHTSLRTRENLLEFSWDVLPHSPYSLDLASLDYHLFRFLKNSLDGKNFPNLDAIKIYLEQFFVEKPKTFSDSWSVQSLD